MRFGNSAVTLEREKVTAVKYLDWRGFSRTCGTNVRHRNDANSLRGIFHGEH
jgi:hypothetical protein